MERRSTVCPLKYSFQKCLTWIWGLVYLGQSGSHISHHYIRKSSSSAPGLIPCPEFLCPAPFSLCQSIYEFILLMMAYIGILMMEILKHEFKSNRRRTLSSIAIKCELLMETLTHEFLRHPVTFTKEKLKPKAWGKTWTLKIVACLNDLLARVQQSGYWNLCKVSNKQKKKIAFKMYQWLWHSEIPHGKVISSWSVKIKFGWW